MKELSIEEKAQRYDKALERAKGVIEQNPLMEYLKKEIEYIFHELKESEDEKMRKGIIRNLEYLMDRAEGFVKDELRERIAWLEKQGEQILTNSAKTCKDEQKPAWSEEDEETLKILDRDLQEFYSRRKAQAGSPLFESQMQNVRWLKFLKDRVQPKQEWSEEDETYLDHIITAIKSYYTDDKGKENPWREELLRWLESLRERYTWKPSEEHIHWLKWVINRLPDTEKANEAEAVLKDLLEQLKKLMEE